MNEPTSRDEPARATPRRSRAVPLLAALAILAFLVGSWLFPRAFPILTLERAADRATVEARAERFATEHRLATPEARRAIRFESDDSLTTFLELAVGGARAVQAEARLADVAVWRWRVRFFTPGDPRTTTVALSHDGRVIGFRRALPDSLARRAPDDAAARRLADSVLGGWLARDLSRWTLVASSRVVRPESGRLDRTFTYERTDRRIGAAPIRLDVSLAGDLPSAVLEYVVVPQSFLRRYGEMRSANDLYANVASVGYVLALAIALVVLVQGLRRRALRWRPALGLAWLAGLLSGVAAINSLGPSFWYQYDPALGGVLLHSVMAALAAVATGVGMGLFVALLAVTGEWLVRRAFPWHHDWWSLHRALGTRAIAARVAGGYANAAIGFAYVALFYLATQRLLGWWVPGQLLDDPDLVATPMPWVGAIALSLGAAVTEELLFRAIPLSLVALWAGDRPWRRQALLAGVLLTALSFAFAHANYPSWPAYSRGVELLLESIAWAAIFLRFGLPVTVLAHFLYDLVLFGLFATAGDTLPYRVALVAVGVTGLLPAALVAHRWWRQGRRWADDATAVRFADVREADAEPGAAYDVMTAGAAVPVDAPGEVGERLSPVRGVAPGGRAAALSSFARRLALPVAALGLVASIGVASRERETLGAPWRADARRAVAVGDSLLRLRGVDADRWRRFAATTTQPVAGAEDFLSEHDGGARLRETLATTYLPPTLWVVRYLRPDSALAVRAESWEVRLLPDGRPWSVRHVLPDERPGEAPGADSARRIAEAAAREAAPGARLRETRLDERVRPARRDHVVEFVDEGTPLPGGATARVRVVVAGGEAVGAERFVHVPASWREGREKRRIPGLAASAVAALVAFAILFSAGWRTLRAPAGIPRAPLPWIPLAAVVFGVLLLGQVNGLRGGVVHGYDTAVPWTTFIAESALAALLASAAGAFALIGGVTLADALRRRIGVPLLPHGDGTDALRAGFAIAGALQLARALVTVAGDDGTPPAPTTALDALAPWLAGALDLALELPVATVAAAVLGLGVAAVYKGSARQAAVLCAMVLLSSFTAAQAIDGAREGMEATLRLLVVAGAAAAAVLAWGRIAAVTWTIAFAADAIVGSLTRLPGPARHPADALAIGLGALVPLLALLLLSRRLRARTD